MSDSTDRRPTGGRTQATLADRGPVERRSLRFRVVTSLFIASALWVPFLLAALWGAMLSFEDAFLRRQIEVEADRLLADWAEGREMTPGPRFEVFWNRTELPERYGDWRGDLFADGMGRLQDLGEGIWEAEASEGFLAIRRVAGAEFLLFYDVRNLEPLEGMEAEFFVSTGLALGGAFLLVALGLARWLDRGVLVPLRELADATSTWELEEWQHRPMPAAERADEIGQLARASRRAAARIQQSLDWERKFTRNASHELRSPLTVIRGALDILQASPVEPGVERPLARIERAWRRMNSTIEAFLWLAREEVEVPKTATEIHPLVDDCLAQLPRRPDRKIDVERRIEPALALPISAPALRIVLDNLLGNALRHGADGTIVLAIDPHALQVTNPTLAPIENAVDLPTPFVGDGSGVGLAIVEDLCARHGWSLELEPQEHSLTVRIHFTPPDGA